MRPTDDFVLVARADRLDRLAGGGSPSSTTRPAPSLSTEVLSLSPQLPLEGLIAPRRV